MDWLYLDNNATTQPAPEVATAVRELHEELWANPSSVHRFGQQVRQRVELARASVSRLLGCRDRHIVFTSGGTESNNLALRGVLMPPPDAPVRQRVLITTGLEHSAIREPAQFMDSTGIAVIYLPTNAIGRVSADDLTASLRQHATPGRTTLVSVQWANNETGIIQPIAELLAACRQHAADSGAKVLFHTDATQAVGKIPVDLRQTPVDLLTFAAHKFHGPKGVGGLYVAPGVRLTPQNLGGPQERERRGGTENTPGIVGLGVAAELAADFLADHAKIDNLRTLRNRLEKGIQAALPELPITVNSQSDPDDRLWNTSNIGFPRLEAEAILVGLSEQGLCASAGAACSSGSLEPSPVLLAMGIPEEIAHGSVRFSLSRYTTAHEIDRAVEIVQSAVRKLMKTLPM